MCFLWGRNRSFIYCLKEIHSLNQRQNYVLTDGQSVNLSWCQAPICCPRPDFYYCQTVAGLLMWGSLSKKWTDLSFTTAAGPRQRSHIYRLLFLRVKHSDNYKFIYFRRRKTEKQHCLLWFYAATDVSSVVIFTSESLRCWLKSMRWECLELLSTHIAVNTVRHPPQLYYD
jgi:hypothetical protein